MTILWLIRHGQTDWNIEGRYQGQADMPLNAAGLAQAQSLAEQLSNEHFDAIYSSDLQRAKQTGSALADKLGIPMQYDRRLREINQGEWEGQLVSEIIKHYGPEFKIRRLNPEIARAPGGESVSEVALRLTAAIDDISRAHPQGKVLVISHGLALATVITRSRGLPLNQVYNLVPENATPYIIEWHSNGKCHEPGD